ncbi:MAG: winged helix-turn-helix domain-containing protein [Blastocatellia bacterium]|nr:winged helix-turn-helix domain-containing protein [Blastocatellia bacterium]
MAIPDFQVLLLPFLQIVEDGNEHTIEEMTSQLATTFALTEAELAEMLPTGVQHRFEYEVRWVRIHLGKARLLDSAGRDRFCISERGREVLAQTPPEISLQFLLQFPEYVEFRNPRNSGPQRQETF